MPARVMSKVQSSGAQVRRRTRQIARIVGAAPYFMWRGTARRPGGPPRIRFAYDDIGAPARYRVDHQVEQARMAGFEVQDAPLEAPRNPYDLTACDLLYLYRLPLTPRTWPLLLAARRMRVPVIFDSDDLVWDPANRQYNFLDDHYGPAVVARIIRDERRTRALMRRADALVFSTRYLAEIAARDFCQPVYVNPNALSAAQVRAADAARSQRQPWRASQPVVIGYFCGTPHVHDEDLASVVPALCAVLDRFPDACLRIYGDLGLAGDLAGSRYSGRIERRAVVRWDDLLWHIAQVDINIAPLVDNPQRRSKSAVKFMEAALVDVPTIAARLEPYRGEIAHGETGMLAATNEEWADGLARLVASPDLRQRIGAAARADVLARHTTAARAPDFAAIIRQVLA